jgi:hypothetical protein
MLPLAILSNYSENKWVEIIFEMKLSSIIVLHCSDFAVGVTHKVMDKKAF